PVSGEVTVTMALTSSPLAGRYSFWAISTVKSVLLISLPPSRDVVPEARQQAGRWLREAHRGFRGCPRASRVSPPGRSAKRCGVRPRRLRRLRRLRRDATRGWQRVSHRQVSPRVWVPRAGTGRGPP